MQNKYQNPIRSMFLFFNSDLFRLCPHFSGRILFALPDARAILFHHDLLCNGTRSVTDGQITYWGEQAEKILRFN